MYSIKGCTYEGFVTKFLTILPSSDAKLLETPADEGKDSKQRKVQNSFTMSYLRLTLYFAKVLKIVEASKSAK